jgi:hypothetical protein
LKENGCSDFWTNGSGGLLHGLSSAIGVCSTGKFSRYRINQKSVFPRPANDPHRVLTSFRFPSTAGPLLKKFSVSDILSWQFVILEADESRFFEAALRSKPGLPLPEREWQPCNLFPRSGDFMSMAGREGLIRFLTDAGGGLAIMLRSHAEKEWILAD